MDTILHLAHPSYKILQMKALALIEKEAGEEHEYNCQHRIHLRK